MRHLSSRIVYTPLIERAVAFAIQVHEIDQQQKRKSKDIPYIVHPLLVGMILSLAEASEDVIVAGILHDTIEDSISEKKISREVLAKQFGENVANLVVSVSELQKDLLWKERKREALERVATFSCDALLIKSADIVSNATELLDDYGNERERIFSRFNGPKDKVIAHYISMIGAISERWKENPFFEDLEKLSGKLGLLL